MLDYDEEAAHYDETRGGEARAQATARALSALLPGAARVVLDVAGGTGIVAEALTSTERCVLVCDASQGMLRRAA
ncbi:MAG: SAM-dependent methyltransferase, partial [Actinomycetota bacterium]|nr:SAM-dependent methyltransferase [Actinomycetota bacterium]